jgi:hypothetical protein
VRGRDTRGRPRRNRGWRGKSGIDYRVDRRIGGEIGDEIGRSRPDCLNGWQPGNAARHCCGRSAARVRKPGVDAGGGNETQNETDQTPHDAINLSERYYARHVAGVAA